MSASVTVVDYGAGNLHSVRNAFEHCGARVSVTSDARAIESADRLVLPGVGAFSDGMAGLRQTGLDQAVLRFAETERPLLGICLGMQMLATESEEFGRHHGLNLISGRVIALPKAASGGQPMKIPQVGWSALNIPCDGNWSESVLAKTEPGTAVYLVHSYHFVADQGADVLATCNYGGNTIVSAIRSGSITGCQFHPEKSGIAGLTMLAEFLAE